MDRTCLTCQATFTVSDDDLAFLEKVSPVIGDQVYTIDPPKCCPECRMRRRMMFRNEHVFYRRTCDKTGDPIISIYHTESEQTVYNQKLWWSDDWDALEYGREFDFTRPFFEQYNELVKQVPAIALWTIECDENAEYNTASFRLKNSYMNSKCDDSEDLLYCSVGEFCTSCTDCSFVDHCQVCYECLDCEQSYGCRFSEKLINCYDNYFCRDMVGCKNCFGCHGLRQKEYYINNQLVSPQEWRDFIDNFVYTEASITEAKSKLDQLSLQYPVVATKQVQCENSTGDHLYTCKNAENCFDVHHAEEIKNVIYGPWNIKYVQDAYALAGIELAYEVTGGGDDVHHVAFINSMGHGPVDCFYCTLCVNGTHDCFGCAGLKKQQYCIFNKQYTKEEYETLVPKIIEHMKQAGEWGEFFPEWMSPFAFNETIASNFMPLSKEEVLTRNWRWKDDIDQAETVEKVIPADRLPDHIADVPDDILNWAIECQTTGRQYRITAQELEFYRQQGLPVPRLHYDERFKLRMAKRNPLKLWTRKCAKCDKEVQTSYGPDRPETVLCEECYLKEMY